MLNKKIVIVTVVCLVCTLLFSLSTVKADNTNLGSIPNAWSIYTGAWRGIGSDGITYPVSWEGKTAIKMDRSQEYVNLGMSATNEMTAAPITVFPGDHVVLKAWFWVPSSSSPENNGDLAPYAGGVLNIDLRGNNGRICAIGTSDGQQSYNSITNTYASASAQSTMTSNFGTQSWEQVTMDFVVQETYISDGWGGLPAGQYSSPTSMSPLIVLADQDLVDGNTPIYVADIEIYVNPSSTINPTPTPTVTPTQGGSGGGYYSTPTPSPTPEQNGDANEDSINPLFFVVCATGLMLFLSKDKKRKRKKC